LALTRGEVWAARQDSMSFLFGPTSFNANKCKTALKLCVGRIKLLKNKKAVSIRATRQETAELLRAGKGDNASIRVEGVMREEDLVAAYEMLELYCELVSVRLQLIQANKEIPSDLKEAVATIIYASRRTLELPELGQVREQFGLKYGKEYAGACAEQGTASACGVAAAMIKFLTASSPDPMKKIEKLEEIAQAEGVPYDAKAAIARLTASSVPSVPVAVAEQPAIPVAFSPPPVTNTALPDYAVTPPQAAVTAIPVSRNTAPGGYEPPTFVPEEDKSTFAEEYATSAEAAAAAERYAERAEQAAQAAKRLAGESSQGKDSGSSGGGKAVDPPVIIAAKQASSEIPSAPPGFGDNNAPSAPAGLGEDDIPSPPLRKGLEPEVPKPPVAPPDLPQGGGDDVDDKDMMDDLTKRFEALKNKKYPEV